MTQPSSAQQSLVQSQQVVFNSSVHNHTPVPLQDDLDSKDNGAYDRSHFLKGPTSATPPTSESIGSAFSSFRSVAPSYGSQNVRFIHTRHDLQHTKI